MIRGTDDQINDEKEILFKIKSNIINKKTITFEVYNNQAIIDENNIISKNSSWFLIKQSKIGMKMNKYKLNSGDIIKIGRITLRIRDIHFSSNKTNNNKNDALNNSEN